jgi:hypothetical protein
VSGHEIGWRENMSIDHPGPTHGDDSTVSGRKLGLRSPKACTGADSQPWPRARRASEFDHQVARVVARRVAALARSNPADVLMHLRHNPFHDDPERRALQWIDPGHDILLRERRSTPRAINAR